MSFSHSLTRSCLEVVPRVAGDLLLQGVEQRQHRRGDHRLLHRLVRVADRPLQRVGGIGLVAERAAGQLGQLAVVAVGEDGEELPPAGQVVGQARAGQGVRQRIGGEARPTLLAVGDDRRAGGLQVLDGVLDGRVLLLLQRRLVDLPLVVGRVGGLQRARAGQGADRLRRDARLGPRVVVAHRTCTPRRSPVRPSPHAVASRRRTWHAHDRPSLEEPPSGVAGCPPWTMVEADRPVSLRVRLGGGGVNGAPPRPARRKPPAESEFSDRPSLPTRRRRDHGRRPSPKPSC